MQKQNKSDYNTLWFAGFIILIFLAGSLFFVYTLRQRNLDQSIQYMQDATSQRKTALQQQINGDMQLLEGVAVSLSEIYLFDDRRVLSILHNINEGNAFEMMGLAETDGMVDFVDAEGPTLSDVDISGLPVFQNALQGQAGISETFEDPRTGQMVNYYAQPVWQNGKIARVLCAVNSGEVFEEIIAVPVFQGNGYFAVIDSAGTIVAPTIDPFPEVQIGANIFDFIEISPEEKTRLEEALQNKEEGTFNFSVGGVRQLSILQPVGVNDWSIISVDPHESINSFYNQSAVGTIILIGAACLVFLYLLLRQIRLMRKNREGLEYLAYTDPLTGARNYTKFLLDAEEILQSNPKERDDPARSKYAVWSFDIKKFNTINEVFGSATGDKVLQRVASVFASDQIPEAIFCRVAADQFAGLRPYEKDSELEAWFFAKYGTLNDRVVIPYNRMRIDDTIGFYCIDDFKEDIPVDDMVNRATTAKKSAKELAGTNVAFFSTKMSDRQRWNAQLEASAKAAVENNDITFFLQPKVAIQNGYRVVGAEALARWLHPEYGMIPPIEFIPLFEENKFIVDLDRHIFETVCLWYLENQRQAGAPLRIAINVSRLGVLQGDFIEFYTKIKNQHQIPDGVLELEFTESVVFEDYSLFRGLVLELQSKGFICSIDDFGSGYSSLNVLKNLPIDVLKLDAVFFRDSTGTSRDQIVVANFIAMARELGIKTVAEGVETADQVHFLQQVCCDIVQGYVFSKPLSQQAFAQMLADTGARLTLP